MAYFTPAEHPDERYYIFGKEGGLKLADKLGINILAQIPLVASIADSGDNGAPIALTDSITGHAFAHLAHEVVDAVNRRNNDLPPTEKVHLNH